MAWRGICLILLLVAGFHLATIAQAQTDYSFDDWLEARERLERKAAKWEVGKRGVSEEEALSDVLFSRDVIRVPPAIGSEQTEMTLEQLEVHDAEHVRKEAWHRPHDPIWQEIYSKFTLAEKRYFASFASMLTSSYRFLSPAQKRLSDYHQFLKDKAETGEYSVSVEAVLAKRIAETMKEHAAYRYSEAELEKSAAEAKKRGDILLAIAATIAIAVTVVILLVFKARHRIAATISRRWGRKSKFFRAWTFGCFFWALGTLLFILLVNPYGSRMDGGEVLHMFSVMIVPPLFLGAVWRGYKRFVE